MLEHFGVSLLIVPQHLWSLCPGRAAANNSSRQNTPQGDKASTKGASKSHLTPPADRSVSPAQLGAQQQNIPEQPQKRGSLKGDTKQRRTKHSSGHKRTGADLEKLGTPQLASSSELSTSSQTRQQLQPWLPAGSLGQAEPLCTRPIQHRITTPPRKRKKPFTYLASLLRSSAATATPAAPARPCSTAPGCP